jgi:hypothetical protein
MEYVIFLHSLVGWYIHILTLMCLLACRWEIWSFQHHIDIGHFLCKILQNMVLGYKHIFGYMWILRSLSKIPADHLNSVLDI